MIGGQHKKERISERLQNCQNQPKNRCYLPGTQLLTGGYSTKTLQGNWSEERADAGYYDGKAIVPTHLSKIWTTEYTVMTNHAMKRAQEQAPVFDQATLVDIVDRNHRAYPTHQPHLDPQLPKLKEEAFKTTMRTSFNNPQEVKLREEAYVRPVIGNTPAAQARAIIMRFRRQLLISMEGQSAFPGNVLRQVRLALERNDVVGNGVLNVEETFRGFTEAGVETSIPECVALVRGLDMKGDNMLSIRKVMDEMRGEERDRRYSIIEGVYELLKKLCSNGVVRLHHLVDLIDVDSMESVLNGTVSSADALRAFTTQWDLPLEAHISFETFHTFFRDSSFELKTDQEFEILMRNVWHLSGGNGKNVNTSCRRLNVVHKDGRASVQEVKDDLDIKDDDPNLMERILANLATQGIKDVSSLTIIPKRR
ncbi:hypothetical protein, conserved [Trypanosoma brucei gambiense DAL972]|uniref:EF-hand domain-containing protein n=2 Tax=Trypanosoma brucei TaxID=5691 RepID=D0A0G4_TRYB9|nr:hypothetical protein, conserved [Trypanosoma brucei gambiense DAL972]CBH16722.1 hypothetical protein, conserved [Trypanosoma brucei gambiense DAL972]|eukprot:XP_011778986.1 hypothetical protein, conserved [Trypanosoma brucei gambiense DAL972]